ncbi:MAG: outer membrane lipoprotein-sorting protein [Pontiellaceae bacterium]
MIKKLILTLFLIPLISFGDSAERILNEAINRLPKEPLEIKGTLRIRTPNGSNKFIHSVHIISKLGESIPLTKYKINDDTMLMEWIKLKPTYTFSNSSTKITDDISSTKMTWGELSFSFLWWKNAKIIKMSKKINRSAWLIEIPYPESDNTLRVWIDAEMLFPLEVQSLNKNRKIEKTLRVKRFRKIDEIWFPQQIEILHQSSQDRSILWIDEISIIK